MKFKTEYNDLKWTALASDHETGRYMMNNVIVMQSHLLASDGRRIHLTEVSSEFCDWIRENVVGEPSETESPVDDYFFLSFRDKKPKGYQNLFAQNILAGQAVYRARPHNWPIRAIRSIFGEKYEITKEMPIVNPTYYREAFDCPDLSYQVNEARTMLKIGRDNRLAVICSVDTGRGKAVECIDLPKV